MTEEREMTALDAPVGAGAEQSLNNYNGIIFSDERVYPLTR